MESENILNTKAAEAGIKEFIIQSFKFLSTPKRRKGILNQQEAISEASLIKQQLEMGLTRKQVQTVNLMKQLSAIKAENYLSILLLASPEIKDVSSVNSVDNDWLLLHQEKASMYSDEEMQYLWAKILAGEINAPGSFSTRTLSIVSQLTKETADVFSKLPSFEFCIDGEIPRIMILDDTSEIYTKRGITHDTLNELASCGLISFRTGPIWGGVLALYSDTPEHFVKYGERTVLFKYKKNSESNYYIILGVVALTKSGSELFRICEAEHEDEIFTFTIENWEKK